MIVGFLEQHTPSPKHSVNVAFLLKHKVMSGVDYIPNNVMYDSNKNNLISEANMVVITIFNNAA